MIVFHVEELLILNACHCPKCGGDGVYNKERIVQREVEPTSKELKELEAMAKRIGNARKEAFDGDTHE